MASVSMTPLGPFLGMCNAGKRARERHIQAGPRNHLGSDDAGRQPLDTDKAGVQNGLADLLGHDEAGMQSWHLDDVPALQPSRMQCPPHWNPARPEICLLKVEKRRRRQIHWYGVLN